MEGCLAKENAAATQTRKMFNGLHAASQAYHALRGVRRRGDLYPGKS
jgi:hypothetical protein